MTDTPQIDDRRRFKELWKELLFARAAGGLASSLSLGMLAIISERSSEVLLNFDDLPGGNSMAEVWVVVVVMAALPSAFAKGGGPSAKTRAAKYGLDVLLLTTILVAAALAAAFGGGKLLAGHNLGPVAALATMFGAAGLAEGLMERSISTVYCGLLGGAAAGALAGALFYAGAIGPWSTPGLLFCLVCGPVAHLSIGLSLALGRWIRDRPKRNQEQVND